MSRKMKFGRFPIDIVIFVLGHFIVTHPVGSAVCDLHRRKDIMFLRPSPFLSNSLQENWNCYKQTAMKLVRRVWHREQLIIFCGWLGLLYCAGNDDSGASALVSSELDEVRDGSSLVSSPAKVCWMHNRLVASFTAVCHKRDTFVSNVTSTIGLWEVVCCNRRQLEVLFRQ